MTATTAYMIDGMTLFSSFVGLPLHEHTDELNDCGTKNDDVERRKQQQHEREHELHAHLVRAFLRALTPFRARRVGMDAQRLGDAGSEPIRLNQHAYQRTDIVALRALGKAS